VSSYIIDGWQGTFNRAATLAISCQQVTPPGSPSFQSAFQQALQIKATTGLASLAIGDYAILENLIEGYRVERLGFGGSNAQSVTIGFWVYATIAGTMTVTLRNGGTSRTIPVNVTISNATTWEYKTVTFAGDTSGTWLFTTGVGLRVTFCFGAGSNFFGTNNSWASANTFATSSTTNFFASTNNLACVTGLVVLPGADAPSSARSPFVMRPYEQELFICRRYYEVTEFVSNTGICAQAISASQAVGTIIPYVVAKRVLPTVSIGGGGFVALTAGAGSAGGSASVNTATQTGVRIDVTGAAGLVAGNAAFIWQTGTSPSTIKVDARL
jgi:hypothetical protein